MKKLSRTQLKTINGSGCPGGCPAGNTYGPPGSGAAHSCAAYQSLSQCCKNEAFLSPACVGPVIS
ncbi:MULTISPECIES: bacteriocin-like protein [Chryseobacterium]|uniref:bacteriocin-like protein n=1 Tax=Chryseobacterium TaxID=59732 RepID=UPI001BE5AAAA|nr:MULTISPECIES: hypothetical protein [Chryseobacterium]MBT2623136.1 hypothetical protein [Chryseobacterium sp. ISL-6]